MVTNYKDLASDRAKKLASELEFMTDGEVLVARVNKGFKFMDRGGMVPAFTVEGATWEGVCDSLAAVMDAMAFYADMVRKED